MYDKEHINNEVSIEYGYNRNKVIIKGIVVEEFEDDGIEVPYVLIKDMEFNKLNEFPPIKIDCTYAGQDEKNIEEIRKHISEFVIHEVDELSATLFITIIDLGILETDDENLKSKYISNYKMIVDNRNDCELPSDGEYYYDEEAREERENEKYNSELPIRFFATVDGFCYKDIFRKLPKLLQELHGETMKKLGF